MKIEHIAMYVNDLEKAKNFFVRYFEASAGPLYKNPVTRFQSYMVSFEDGSRLELMKAAHMTDDHKPLDRTGYAHVCFSVGSKDKVDEMCRLLKQDGFPVISNPRQTGGGGYTCRVIAFEGNQIEITE
jgi:lactoylglutathione lyase